MSSSFAIATEKGLLHIGAPFLLSLNVLVAELAATLSKALPREKAVSTLVAMNALVSSGAIRAFRRGPGGAKRLFSLSSSAFRGSTLWRQAQAKTFHDWMLFKRARQRE